MTPPEGISSQVFGERLKQAARDYDGSQPYNLPRFDPNSSPYTLFGPPEPNPFPTFHARNSIEPGEYNSNSFAAALLNRAGAASNIAELQKHLTTNRYAAPGLEQPLPQRYFRNR